MAYNFMLNGQKKSKNQKHCFELSFCCFQNYFNNFITYKSTFILPLTQPVPGNYNDYFLKVSYIVSSRYGKSSNKIHNPYHGL